MPREADTPFRDAFQKDVRRQQQSAARTADQISGAVEFRILFGRQVLPAWVIASCAGIWLDPGFGRFLGAGAPVYEWQKRESQRKRNEAGALSCLPVLQWC